MGECDDDAGPLLTQLPIESNRLTLQVSNDSYIIIIYLL